MDATGGPADATDAEPKSRQSAKASLASLFSPVSSGFATIPISSTVYLRAIDIVVQI